MKKLLFVLSLVVLFLGYVGREIWLGGSFDFYPLVGVSVSMALFTGFLYNWKANVFSTVFGFIFGVLVAAMVSSLLVDLLLISNIGVEITWREIVLAVLVTLVFGVGGGILVFAANYLSVTSLEERIFHYKYESKFLDCMLLVASHGVVVATTVSLAVIPFTIAVLAYMAFYMAPKYDTGYRSSLA